MSSEKASKFTGVKKLLKHSSKYRGRLIGGIVSGIVALDEIPGDESALKNHGIGCASVDPVADGDAVFVGDDMAFAFECGRHLVHFECDVLGIISGHGADFVQIDAKAGELIDIEVGDIGDFRRCGFV